MTDEQLTRLEKMHSETQPSAPAEIYQWFPEIAKALREARASLEWQAAMTKALSESQERLAQEVKEARAEVAKVREVMRQNTFDCEEEVAAAQLRAAEWRRDANRYARELSDARAEVERLKSLSDTLQDFAEADCAYGDNCPSNAGTRHGTCDACKAREALAKAGISLRSAEVMP